MAAAKKASKPGLYANIHAKQERIAHGSGETMRKPGSAGAPSDRDVGVRPPDHPPTESAPESEKAGLIFERS